MKTWTIIALALAALTGCSATFERQVMQDRLQADQPVFTDYDIEKIDRLRPQLPTPCRIAVAPPRAWLGESWTTEERELITAWGNELREKGLVSDVVLIPHLMLAKGSDPTSNLKALRVAAARCRADALLVLNYVTDTDRYVNPLSVLNLTVIGMWVVPGHTAESLTIMEGMLLDTRNEYVYYAAQAEGDATVAIPAMHGENKEVEQASRCLALRAFGEELCRRAGSLCAAPSGAPGRRYETPGGGR